MSKLRAIRAAKRNCFCGSKFAWLRLAAQQSITANSGRSEMAECESEQREAIVRDGGGLVDLWEVSPARFEDNKRTRKR